MRPAKARGAAAVGWDARTLDSLHAVSGCCSATALHLQLLPAPPLATPCYTLHPAPRTRQARDLVGQRAQPAARQLQPSQAARKAGQLLWQAKAVEAAL